MAAQLWINDGGVARQIKTIWVNDAGVARRIKQIWVNDSGVARKVFQYADELSLVAGQFVSASVTIGYSSTVGSLTPTTLSDGMTVDYLYQDYDVPQNFVLAIRGFSSDPGQSYLTSIALNGSTLLSSAASYFYSGGTAIWQWLTNIGIANGGSYAVTIIRS